MTSSLSWRVLIVTVIYSKELKGWTKWANRHVSSTNATPPADTTLASSSAEAQAAGLSTPASPPATPTPSSDPTAPDAPFDRTIKPSADPASAPALGDTVYAVHVRLDTGKPLDALTHDEALDLLRALPLDIRFVPCAGVADVPAPPSPPGPESERVRLVPYVPDAEDKASTAKADTDKSAAAVRLAMGTLGSASSRSRSKGRRESLEGPSRRGYHRARPWPSPSLEDPMQGGGTRKRARADESSADGSADEDPFAMGSSSVANKPPAQKRLRKDGA